MAAPSPLVIACDFDGVICQEAYPRIGRANLATIIALRQARANGHKLILCTCREGPLLDAALAWCGAFELQFDAVNANLPERIARYGCDCRKIGADIYIDDRTPGFSTDLVLSYLWDLLALGPCAVPPQEEVTAPC